MLEKSYLTSINKSDQLVFFKYHVKHIKDNLEPFLPLPRFCGQEDSIENDDQHDEASEPHGTRYEVHVRLDPFRWPYLVQFSFNWSTAKNISDYFQSLIKLFPYMGPLHKSLK